MQRNVLSPTILQWVWTWFQVQESQQLPIPIGVHGQLHRNQYLGMWWVGLVGHRIGGQAQVCAQNRVKNINKILINKQTKVKKKKAREKD